MGPYSSIACDQTIEQTLNKDSKTKGGVVGFTLSPNAVNRWTLARSARASILRTTEEMAGIGTTKKNQKYLQKSAIVRYNNDVSKVKSTISTMINPFDLEYKSTQLVCISSGVQENPGVEKDFSNAESIGKEKLGYSVSNAGFFSVW